MKTSHYFLSLLPHLISQTENQSHSLMQSAGLIRQTSHTKEYAWLPFGWELLKKIKKYLQAEMQVIGAHEIHLPSQEDVLPQSQAAQLMQMELRSYKQLPLILYQVKPLHIDVFSFHPDSDSLEQTSQTLLNTYQRIFSQWGLSGEFEEDTEKKRFVMHHQEIACISKEGYQFTQPAKVHILNEKGKGTVVAMGYSRIQLGSLVSAIVQEKHDEQGIIWPFAISPFQVAIIPINFHKSYRVRTVSENLYKTLQAASFDVLFEDQKERLGTLFAQLNFMGIPFRLIINERYLDETPIEWQNRETGEVLKIPVEEVIPRLQKEQERFFTVTCESN